MRLASGPSEVSRVECCPTACLVHAAMKYCMRRLVRQDIPDAVCGVLIVYVELMKHKGSAGLNCDPLHRRQLSEAQRRLPEQLVGIVGAVHVLSGGGREMAPFTTGARIGRGEALAVCLPGTLKEAIAVMRACVAADVAILPQGRNTGLTGGSVPRDTLCDRPTVIISSGRLNKIHLVEGNDSAPQLLCQAGAGIHDLSLRAAEIGRESHSILGSLFLNPTVAAGVALGSGGTQLRKGPAYTERALWGKISATGDVELVNTLGITAESEEALLDRLENGDLTNMDVSAAARPASSAASYAKDVCCLDGQVSSAQLLI